MADVTVELVDLVRVWELAAAWRSVHPDTTTPDSAKAIDAIEKCIDATAAGEVPARVAGPDEVVVKRSLLDNTAALLDECAKSAGLPEYATARLLREKADGNAYGLHTEVRHPKKPGDTVKAGEVIGHVADTGDSSGPHVQFELRRDTGPELADDLPQPEVLPEKGRGKRLYAETPRLLSIRRDHQELEDRAVERALAVVTRSLRTVADEAELRIYDDVAEEIEREAGR